MSGYLEKAQLEANGDAKTRRKLLDQRRMEYRRAIENYAEQRHLQQQLTDYPELIAASLFQRRAALSPGEKRA